MFENVDNINFKLQNISEKMNSLTYIFFLIEKIFSLGGNSCYLFQQNLGKASKSFMQNNSEGRKTHY